jgi:hypothetical protein
MNVLSLLKGCSHGIIESGWFGISDLYSNSVDGVLVEVEEVGFSWQEVHKRMLLKSWLKRSGLVPCLMLKRCWQRWSCSP